MQQFFDRPWDSLDVESVRRFLADADDEGVLWEAKGTRVPHRDSVRKAVCGFANSLGGYLILGAERRNNASWELTGLQFRHPEPGTWVGSLIAAGVSPLPVFDSKQFELGDGRQAVVVQVEPVAVPPCMTASGVVYQRVSGQTLPVTDQRVLADLLEKGATARGLHSGRAHRRASRWREPAGLVKRVRNPVVYEQLRDAVVGVPLGFLASKQLERIGRRDIATGIERCREQLIRHRKQRGLLEGRHLSCTRDRGRREAILRLHRRGWACHLRHKPPIELAAGARADSLIKGLDELAYGAKADARLQVADERLRPGLPVADYPQRAAANTSRDEVTGSDASSVGR